MKSLKFVLFIFLFSCVNKDRLTGWDYRLFQDTPAWDLAKAVSNQDTKKIEQIVKSEHVNIDYQDPKFGSTLLMVAVLNNQLKSVETLLKLGANPNKHDTYNGTSPIIAAAGYTGSTDHDNTDALELLLKYHANPNDEEIGERRKGNYFRRTPLLSASNESIEKVKILLDAGADINHRTDLGSNALGRALIMDKNDIALYLLQRGADYTRSTSKVENKEYKIQDELRYKIYPLNSNEYKLKMKIVDFLKSRGIDYRSTPVPESAVKKAKELYPDNWEEYLKVY